MKYHDFHLREYLVLEHGSRVILRLELEQERSEIEFCDVVLYHFVHTCGAIITDIMEVPLAQFVSDKEQILKAWAHQHGIAHWQDDASSFAPELFESHSAWVIESAIGFSGFVIAKEIKENEA
ncbi:MAG TPA: hypothetical protein VEH04_01515 [Verrucomicrobiae bacterium]|nr:hypothetical protein [Verrucomicrobiae bacterium]